MFLFYSLQRYMIFVTMPAPVLEIEIAHFHGEDTGCEGYLNLATATRLFQAA